MPLSDAQWALLPERSPRRGGRWRAHRRVIDAIARKYQIGTQWRQLPSEFGSWKGVYTRLRTWAVDGTWQQVFAALVARAAADGILDWSWRWTPRSCAPTSTQPVRGKGAGVAGGPPDHTLGRSRGGRTTTIHLASDPRCRPLVLLLTPGQCGGAPYFPLIIRALRVPRPIGHPRTRPQAVLADKAYSYKTIREHLRRRGIRAIIPEPGDQIANRAHRGSRVGHRHSTSTQLRRK